MEARSRTEELKTAASAVNPHCAIRGNPRQYPSPLVAARSVGASQLMRCCHEAGERRWNCIAGVQVVDGAISCGAVERRSSVRGRGYAGSRSSLSPISIGRCQVQSRAPISSETARPGFPAAWPRASHAFPWQSQVSPKIPVLHLGLPSSWQRTKELLLPHPVPSSSSKAHGALSRHLATIGWHHGMV